ncbi:unnamed protein product [Peniophora sp. CBMAI 1063]|nr:unnamed protein product [Peniophora sp. CBMAI 1063]
MSDLLILLALVPFAGLVSATPASHMVDDDRDPSSRFHADARDILKDPWKRSDEIIAELQDCLESRYGLPTPISGAVLNNPTIQLLLQERDNDIQMRYDEEMGLLEIKANLVGIRERFAKSYQTIKMFIEADRPKERACTHACTELLADYRVLCEAVELKFEDVSAAQRVARDEMAALARMCLNLGEPARARSSPSSEDVM